MMSFKASFMLLLFTLALVLKSDAIESSAELYWKKRLGNIPMPKTLKYSLQHDAQGGKVSYVADPINQDSQGGKVNDGRQTDPDAREALVTYARPFDLDAQSAKVNNARSTDPDAREALVTYARPFDLDDRGDKVNSARPIDPDAREALVTYAHPFDLDAPSGKVNNVHPTDPDAREALVTYARPFDLDTQRGNVNNAHSTDPDAREALVTYARPFELGSQGNKVNNARPTDPDAREALVTYARPFEVDAQDNKVNNARPTDPDAREALVTYGRPFDLDTQGDKVKSASPTDPDAREALVTYARPFEVDAQGAKINNAHATTIVNQQEVQNNHYKYVKKDARVIYFKYEKLFQPGTKMMLHFRKIDNEVKFLPLYVTKSLEITSNKFLTILDILSVNPKSATAKYIKDTLNDCKENGIKAEERFCATSMESMVDKITLNMNPQKDKIMVLSTEDGDDNLMEYKIQKADKLEKDDDHGTVCHKLLNPYAVFLCHNVKSTEVYGVSLLDDNGKKMKSIVVCHKDTTDWNPKHLAFELLNLKPGSKPICHFLSGDAMVWLKK